ncbi:MAG: nucleotidyltransferase domain-containing protein [Nanoarchaeota archaeon]
MKKQELIKPIIRVGNSSGVVLPKEWLNGKAKVKLIEKPLDIKKDILEILDPFFESIKGIYLCGSYARQEQTEKSDVDFLIITSNVNKRIQQGIYNAILISEQELERQLRENALPVLQMLKESKVLLNKQLIEDYRKIPLTNKNIKWHLDTTKSAMKIVKKKIELYKELEEPIDASAVYSLILRLRTLYIIECLNKNKKYNNKDFLKIIKNNVGNLNAYEVYSNVKNNKDSKKTISLKESEALRKLVLTKLKKIEKWLRDKKD